MWHVTWRKKYQKITGIDQENTFDSVGQKAENTAFPTKKTDFEGGWDVEISPGSGLQIAGDTDGPTRQLFQINTG